MHPASGWSSLDHTQTMEPRPRQEPEQGGNQQMEAEKA